MYRSFYKELKLSQKGNKEIFKDIINLNKDVFDAFESYSKIYSSIIKLDRNDNSDFNNIIYYFIKEKLLIIFEHENRIFGQMGNINNNSNEENIFDIDYLISIKESKNKNKGNTILNDFLKEKENYNNFYKNINDSSQNICFEYKISNKLILNVLNVKKNKENNILIENNPFFYINNINNIKKNNNNSIHNYQKSISNNNYEFQEDKNNIINESPFASECDEDFNQKLKNLINQ